MLAHMLKTCITLIAVPTGDVSLSGTRSPTAALVTFSYLNNASAKLVPKDHGRLSWVAHSVSICGDLFHIWPDSN